MIHLSNITKQYGNRVLYRQGSFQVNSGEKIGLVGPNGHGKSTLFKIIMGEEGVDAGQVVKSEKISVGYFSQDIEDMKGRSVLDEVKESAGIVSRLKSRIDFLEGRLSEVLSEEDMARTLEEYGECQSEFERLGGYDLDFRAAEILTGLGIGPEDHLRDTSTFSGGWKMRIALAKILLLNPQVLLMDEPTNHLDLESILWLEDWLVKFKGALLMTSHDRDFMNRIVSKVVEVASGAITVYSGDYDFYEKEKSVRREQLIAASKRQEDMLAKEEEFIARFAARASHAAQVQSRVKKLEKIEKIEVPTEEKSISFEWPSPPRGGDEVFKFQNLGKIWRQQDGREKLVFRGATGLIKRLDRIAVVGVNGAGKSSFLKIVAGGTEATEGRIQLGAQIDIGYFSQNALDVLDPKLTVIEEVHSHFPTAGLGYIRTLLGALKFSQDDVEKKISVLSGGEKSRVVLATILARPVNFLVLDEPTNHLDLSSREVLLAAIQRFPGTVMVVSHDRHFLKAITTKVFELDQNQILITEGNLDYYLEKKQQTLQTLKSMT